MILAMKVYSFISNMIEEEMEPDDLEFAGYIICPANCVFGPWIPFKDYYITREHYKMVTRGGVLLSL